MSGWPNPLIPGFNPDPSIVLVGGTYYLVTSTFEYLPGIPLYRSTDLVDWEQIGNVITRPAQLDLTDVPTPGGVWAPTIRHRDGVFYLIVTVMFAPGCIVYTATDPRGPWSDGISITGVGGIDPDLAWDDDGTAYVTYATMGVGIHQVTVDLDTGHVLEKPRSLWSGNGLHAPEGPHLYRRGDDWYLLIAEGGTERGHAVSIARGDSPRGPFSAQPGGPFLSARSTASPVQNLGHADLVETPGGGTAAVLLGVRPVGFTRSFSPLGRETFITAVDWVDGWPVADLPDLEHTQPATSYAADFSSADELDNPGWIAVRRQPQQIATVDPTCSALVLTGEGTGLDVATTPFLGRRQTELSATFSARIETSSGRGGIAGRHTEDHWVAIEAESDGADGTRITAIASLAGLVHEWAAALPRTEVTLRIESEAPLADTQAMSELRVGGDRIRLFATAGGEEVMLAELDGRYWSFETTESFTGRVLGVYAVEGDVRFLDVRYHAG